MKKRFLSLFCAFALVAGLLPVTALAAEGAPSQLYVGNQQVINGSDNATYWTTDTDGNLTQSAADQSWNVKYDPATVTLTLRGATIQGGTNTGPAPFGSGIYALCSEGQSVALTIELIGTNTITGNYGIYVDAQQGETVGTNASLLIQNSSNNGILEVSGSSHGIYVKSGTGNASLTIKDASVVASSSSSYDGYAGVCVQSGSDATSSPQLSLAVDGGSLTTSGGESSDGIWFYVGSSQASNATTSLTVSKNAIVAARNGGIKASDSSMSDLSDQIKVSSGDGTNGGIVFDGSTGTVYGTVELQNDLTIGAGETLTVPEGSSLNANGKLTNDGTINVENGGTMTGDPGGTVVSAPTIGTQPENQTVTAGNTATFTVDANGENLSYQWQQKTTDSGSGWTNVGSATSSNTYTIDNTTTSMSGYQYRCVVNNSAGSVTSEVATLTVNEPAPTTYTITADVTPLGAGTATADKTTATAGDTVKLTATANSGYRFTGWTSSGGGTFVNASSESTTFIMPASDVTVTAQFAKVVTGVTLDKETLELFTDGSATLTAAVEPSDATNKNLTWQSDNANVATVQNGTVTAVGVGETTIRVTTEEGNYTATCKVTVTQRSSGGSSTPSKTPSQQAADKIESAKDGATVEITLKSGKTTLDKEVFETLAGRDVTLEINLPGGVLWTINGQDIPADANLTDLDMGVLMGTSTIPVDVFNAITGEVSTIQLSLAHDGAFGFTLTLTAPLGKEYADLWANLYHYDAGALQFEAAARIAADGTVSLPFTHASEYAIIIDDRDRTPKAFPFADVAETDWYYDAVDYAYQNELMNGTSATTFAPNGTMTRAMLVTILHRQAGEPVVNYAMPFADVAAGDWYTEAVRWAAAEGIVTGTGGTTFEPDAPITREQFATILYRYAQQSGADVSVGEDTNILSYTDALEISEYAIPAMQWACGAGVVQGSGGSLNPQDSATRAEAATMLMRYLQL